MSAKKWLSFITFGCSVATLTTALIIGKSEPSIVYDIAMAIFGSALLGLVMSLIEYFVERRHAMEMFWNEARTALGKLRTIQYIDIDAPDEMVMSCFREEQSYPLTKLISENKERTAKNELISWYENNIPMSWTENDDIAEELDRYYSDQIELYRMSVMKCIESCITVANVDLGPLGNAYDNLDFLFENRRVRKDAYDKIYNKITDYRNLAKAELYHFNLLLSGKGNFCVCAGKVFSIVQKVFVEEKKHVEGYESKVVYQTPFDDIDDAIENFRCKIYWQSEPNYPKRTPVFGTMSASAFVAEEGHK